MEPGPTLSLPPQIVPFPVALSAIGIPTLDTIPGSAAHTPPSVHEAKSDARLQDESQSEYLTPLEAPSRRGSHDGSYFTAGPRVSPGISTPGDRPKPAPIAIPLGTPDEPLFSAYPNTGPSRTNSIKAKGKYILPLSTFTLSHPPQRKKGATPTESPVSPVKQRRRASTYSISPVSASTSQLPSTPPRPVKNPRRRLSLGSLETPWSSMPHEVAKRFDPRHEPYAYQHAESEYTFQSVSTLATVKPLSASPHISPRRSSLTLNPVLGLSNVPDVEIVVPDRIPHEPPARRSSLDYGRLELEPKYIPDHLPVSTDMRSLVSASLTGTDTSASAEFSTSPSSKEHPLSSATTSLSRSAKSSKEGPPDEKDAALNAIRLQRSLEWEARQTRHRRRLEKRRMILLELVETEVAYTEDLKTLVQVYLPQLYALPSVSERTADLVARNARVLLEIHMRVAGKMVDVLKEEALGYEPQHPEPVICAQLEKVSRRLAAIFVDEASSFSAYNEYCAGSIAAATLVRHVSQKPEYAGFERRCQIISSSQPHSTLCELLSDTTEVSASNRSRLHFRDFLIMPIQRICRYPLLLNQLLVAETALGDEDTDGYDTGVDVERALGAMRGVAEEADEARRVRENEIKSATLVERIEPHPALTLGFLKALGTCRLIGSLDVLHHHPTVAPLIPPVKVKYLGAFLYKGYLILAKVKKGKVYEAKHFLPLEVFELIDITEGFLPHSVRLSLRDHSFDLAASCETEKEVWAAALCQARDESTVPPFELPASVSPFAARARRMSAAIAPEPPSPTVPMDVKRHTLAGMPGEMEFPEPRHEPLTPTPMVEERRGQPSTILLRRASATQRLMVDRGLMDVFSESCSTARSKAQLHQTLFLPDREISLRRRRSFLDARQASFDIAFTGEVRGNIMPVRQTRSLAGKRRAQGFTVGNESSTEVDTKAYESADETATSDFGTMRHSRAPSLASVSRPHSPLPTRQSAPSTFTLAKRKSLTNMRKSLDLMADSSSIAHLLTRRKSGYHADRPARAKSMPVSPVHTPTEAPPLPELPPLTRPSRSVHASPVRRPAGLRQGSDEMAVYPHGAGLTNHPPTKGWSIRRSMSFIRDNAEVKSRPAMSRNSTDDGFDAGASSAGYSESIEDDEVEVEVGTPRRRKSVRLFSTLRGFTPI